MNTSRPLLAPTLLLLALSSGSLAVSTAAQTTYTRTATGNWTDPAGWSPNGVPGPGDTADLNGRTVTLDAAATVAVLIFPPVVNSVLGGAAALTVTDTLRWEAGQSSMTGTLTVGPQATFRVRGTATLRMGAGGVLVNQGRMVWEAPQRWYDVGRLVNEGEIEIPLDLATPTVLCFSSENPAIMNAPGGLIRRTGPGTVFFSCGFDNDGTIRVEEGAFEQRGFNNIGGTDTGAYEVEAGAMLVFGGGTRTLTASASVTGEGTVEVKNNSNNHALTIDGTYDVPTTRLLGPSSPRFTLNADATLPVLEVTGGWLNGSGDVTVTDALTWTGGTMGGSGTTVLQPDLDLSGATVGLQDTRTLRLEGTTTWSGETDINNNASTVTLVNVGTLLSTGAGARSFGNGTFRNEGLLTHDTGTLTVSGTFDNAGTVALDGGTMSLNAHSASGDTGAYAVDGGAELRFIGGFRTLAGEVSGTGTVAFLGGSVTNTATWQPGALPGVLTVGSNYHAGSGVLEVELGGYAPGTEHDQLDVTGTATLGGTLRVLLDGGFVPIEGDRFLVVPAASVSGTFATVELPDGVEGFVETTAAGAELVIGTVTVANEPDAGRPTAFALHAAFPNPFASRAALRYDVPEAGPVRVVVYDLLGREVAVLVDGVQAAGTHVAALDGARLAAGAYLVRMTTEGGFTQTRRMTSIGGLK